MLDANTTVGEVVVENDEFRARVHGVIYGARLYITPIGDDTYETTSLDSNGKVFALYLEKRPSLVLEITNDVDWQTTSRLNNGD